MVLLGAMQAIEIQPDEVIARYGINCHGKPPTSLAANHRVVQEILVVALREVLPHMPAAGLLAQRSCQRECLAEMEQVRRLPALRAPLLAVVGGRQLDPVELRSQRATRQSARNRRRPSSRAARPHGACRGSAQGGRSRRSPPRPGGGRAAPLQPGDGSRSSAIRRAKTSPSSSELLARRLAPWTPVHDVSPQA